MVNCVLAVSHSSLRIASRARRTQRSTWLRSISKFCRAVASSRETSFRRHSRIAAPEQSETTESKMSAAVDGRRRTHL